MITYSFLDKASVVTKGDYGDDGSFACNPWQLCPVTRVEEVKMLIKLLPIWATTIIFWSTYAQMITFSVEQASTMERSIGHFQIPAGSLTVFFVAAILITLGFYDRFIIPLWKKWKGKPGKRATQPSRSLVKGFTLIHCIVQNYLLTLFLNQWFGFIRAQDLPICS